MKIKILFLSFFLAILATSSIAQEDRPFYGLNIQSPNAAALEKFGKIPVSYHTGIPQISIPIYTISSGSINLPVSLNYHSSGLKVMEISSWVGSGWSLNACGAITREVRGAPDEVLALMPIQVYGHFSDYGFNSYVRNELSLEYADFNDVSSGGSRWRTRHVLFQF